MITLFTSPSCTFCRKAKAWLTEAGFPFEERNIFSNPLIKEELKEFLLLTENGTEELISTRSKVYEKLDIDLDDLSFNEFVELVEQRPGILRHPIITDSKRLQVGFNEEDIHQFTPRKIRRFDAKEKALKLMIMDIQQAN